MWSAAFVAGALRSGPLDLADAHPPLSQVVLYPLLRSHSNGHGDLINHFGCHGISMVARKASAAALGDPTFGKLLVRSSLGFGAAVCLDVQKRMTRLMHARMCGTPTLASAHVVLLCSCVALLLFRRAFVLLCSSCPLPLRSMLDKDRAQQQLRKNLDEHQPLWLTLMQEALLASCKSQETLASEIDKLKRSFEHTLHRISQLTASVSKLLDLQGVLSGCQWCQP